MLFEKKVKRVVDVDVAEDELQKRMEKGKRTLCGLSLSA